MGVQRKASLGKRVLCSFLCTSHDRGACLCRSEDKWKALRIHTFLIGTLFFARAVIVQETPYHFSSPPCDWMGVAWRTSCLHSAKNNPPLVNIRISAPSYATVVKGELTSSTTRLFRAWRETNAHRVSGEDVVVPACMYVLLSLKPDNNR